ncbi:MAG: TetR/AcrR family transcriptional regulator [Steroidobacteraceae bacterium]
MTTRQTQTRILDTALRLFNEFGTAAVSTNRIAEACGISKGNLYYHFRNKNEIVEAVFRRIVDEMNAGWYQDHTQPTIRHMAEMFARQVLLIYEYRFFYREMPSLLRDSVSLMQRYRDNRQRRMAALEDFFVVLDCAGALRFDGDSRLIKSIVHSTWIISDNWLNSQEFLGRPLDDQSVLAGYHLILDILRPYFVHDQRQVLDESREAIHRVIHDRLGT